jgi:hypothetical protein
VIYFPLNKTIKNQLPEIDKRENMEATVSSQASFWHRTMPLPQERQWMEEMVAHQIQLANPHQISAPWQEEVFRVEIRRLYWNTVALSEQENTLPYDSQGLEWMRFLKSRFSNKKLQQCPVPESAALVGREFREWKKFLTQIFKERVLLSFQWPSLLIHRVAATSMAVGVPVPSEAPKSAAKELMKYKSRQERPLSSRFITRPKSMLCSTYVTQHDGNCVQ